MFSNVQTLSSTSVTACIQPIIRHELFTERDALGQILTHMQAHRQKGKERHGDRERPKVSESEREREREIE